MGAVLVPVVFVLVVVVVGVLAMRRFRRESVEQSDRLQDSARPTVSYVVPPGQDPALLVATLVGEGYDASPDSEPGASSPIIIIGSRRGGVLDREQVRQALVRLDHSNINPDESGRLERPPVRFTDE